MKRLLQPPPPSFNGITNRLDRVDQCQYLVHRTSQDLIDVTNMDRERRVPSVWANMIARRFARSSVEVKVTLFKAYSIFYSILFEIITRFA